MLEIQNYMRQNNRTLRKKYRKTLITPLLQKIHYLQNLQTMSLNYLKNHLLNKKVFFLYSLVLFYFFAFRDFAWAAETGTQNANQAINSSIDILNWLVAMITFVVQPLIMFVGWLLSPDWTVGDIINLRPVMHSIWVMVSNFVYIIFAFVLVFIAFINIFWKSESYAIKKSLPKLIVWILIVPFTWFIVSFTLSVSNILTASVISLSYDSIKKFSPPEYTDKKIIPKKIIVDLRENTWATLPASEKTSDCSKNSSDCMSITDLFTNMKWAYNLLPYYAYNIFKIDKLKDISSKQTKDTINKTWDIFKKLTFSIVFALIFAILVIAIAYALVTRVFMLWLFAMFSPLFALDFFLGWKWLWKVWETLKNHMSISKFISLAMVPVYVSAALSFWLVFLSFAINNKYDKTGSFATLQKATKDWKQIMEFWENSSKIQLTFIRNYTDGSSWIAWDVFDTGAGFISNIIISFLALVILWMTVMAALKSDTITWNAVKPISDFWASIWKLALESPKYIPLKLPGTDKTMTMHWISTVWDQIANTVKTMAQWNATEIWQSFWKSLWESIWLKTSEVVNAVNILDKWLKENPNLSTKVSQDERNKAVRDLLWSVPMKWEEAIKNNETRGKIVEVLKKAYDISPEEATSLNSAWNKVDFDKAFRWIKHKYWIDLLSDNSWGMTDDSITWVVWSDKGGVSSWTTITKPNITSNKSDKNRKGDIINIVIKDDKNKDLNKNIDFNTKDYAGKKWEEVNSMISRKLSENWIKPNDDIISKIANEVV